MLLLRQGQKADALQLAETLLEQLPAGGALKWLRFPAGCADPPRTGCQTIHQAHGDSHTYPFYLQRQNGRLANPC